MASESKNIMQDRRRFIRIICDLPALATYGENKENVKIKDLSLMGVLAEAEHPLDLTKGTHVRIDIHLGATLTISMDCAVSHEHGNLIGLGTMRIDIDSITNLRRFIEMNGMSEELLHRDIGHLAGEDDFPPQQDS